VEKNFKIDSRKFVKRYCDNLISAKENGECMCFSEQNFEIFKKNSKYGEDLQIL